MKATQILYLVLVLGIIYWIATSTHLLDSLSEGFENVRVSNPEPIVPKVLDQVKLETDAMPNPSIPGSLPFGPYAQMASVGSFQYQDPAMLSAELPQMKKLQEDLRSFLAFEAVTIANSSDPTVQLPLTQLRADSQKLQQEISTLDKNPGIQAQLTQHDLTDIEGALMFLQKKVRLFETSGVVSGGSEGFQNPKKGSSDPAKPAPSKPAPSKPASTSTPPSKPTSTSTPPTKPTSTSTPPSKPTSTSAPPTNTPSSKPTPSKPTPSKPTPKASKATRVTDKVTTSGVTGSTTGEKTKASKADLETLRTKVYAAILTLSASGTVDPVVQARIKILQKMYTALTEMVTKLNKGQWTEKDIPVYKQDINEILPNLANPKKNVKDIFSQGSGKKLSPIEQQLSALVGPEHATDVFNNLKEKGMFKISMDLGYNVGGPSFKRETKLDKDGTMKSSNGLQREPSITSNKGMQMELPFDTKEPGMDDRHAMVNPSQVSRFDWKKRATTICEQVKLRGLDPLDFGCIPKDSLTSPAYSWRGHAKMVCGRLGTTMDPDLPIACGCPPQKWKGWTLSV